MYKRLLKFHITDIKLHLLGIICCLQKLHKEALPLITTKVIEINKMSINKLRKETHVR